MTVTATIHHHLFHTVTVDIDAEMTDGSGGWFVGWVDNSFDPYKIAVRGENAGDAYDWLLTHPHIVESCKVDPDDPYFEADYGDAEDALSDGRLTMNDNGDILDTEAVILCEPIKLGLRF